MKDETIEIRESWGAILVVAQDKAGTETHHWFDTRGTGGELAQFAEVIHFDEEGKARHYVDDELMMVPDKVIEKLHAEGFEVLNPVGKYEAQGA